MVSAERSRTFTFAITSRSGSAARPPADNAAPNRPLVPTTPSAASAASAMPPPSIAYTAEEAIVFTAARLAPPDVVAAPCSPEPAEAREAVLRANTSISSVPSLRSFALLAPALGCAVWRPSAAARRNSLCCVYNATVKAASPPRSHAASPRNIHWRCLESMSSMHFSWVVARTPPWAAAVSSSRKCCCRSAGRRKKVWKAPRVGAIVLKKWALRRCSASSAARAARRHMRPARRRRPVATAASAASARARCASSSASKC